MGIMYSDEVMNLSIFPVTNKLILVLNQELADKGTEGGKTRSNISFKCNYISGAKI